MSEEVKKIVIVLRSGGDFSFRDVELIIHHINNKWKATVRPRIICLWDQTKHTYNLGNIEILPLTNTYPGTWSRIQLYSPEMEQYRPFLYVDLDTAVIQSLENIFDLVKDESQFITLEDFWQKGKLATGLVWFPAESEKIKKIFNAFKSPSGSRMDRYIREVVTVDTYWQDLTDTIYDFKDKSKKLLTKLPANANLVCLHGKPRIFQAIQGECAIEWLKQYVGTNGQEKPCKRNVTVIIPYNVDRGYLQHAIASVPKDVQLILSKGEGNWPQNFNKVLSQAEGEYIKYLHEDDMLTENCIVDSVKAMEEQKADFIHGNAIQHSQTSGNEILWKPSVKHPTLKNLLQKNTIHSATTMYRRSVFERVGLFNESRDVQSFEEYEFNLRCLKAGLKIGYCNATLAIYRRHPEQLIKKTNKLERRRGRQKYIQMYSR